MLHAVSAPVFKSIALAGLVLGLGAVASSRSPSPVTHRLALHAPSRPQDVYLSLFRHGDVNVRFESGKLESFRHKVYGTLDGCRWVGIETLTLRDDRSFDYDYREQILSCEPDAEVWIKTPRKGIVTVED
jgi:hypothetical protein